MALGTVKWFDQRKGFGFVTDQDGGDLFIHFTTIDPEIRSKLRPGQMVNFDVTAGEKGPKAINVTLAEAPAAPPADPAAP
ncbi:MAG: cold-shock protein [Phycisphaerae bacterium]|nr:cold-shock protein [Phycisphaerae bacterium]